MHAPPAPLSARGLLLAITAIALLLRLADLDGLPAGLWRDESRHAWLALRIWDDPRYRPIYVVEGADLPALLFYLMAPVVGILGPHVWSARLVSALAGALTPLALYWAAAPLIGRRAALAGAALIAWASWSLSISRWAFPATLDHLLVLTAVGALWRGLEGLVRSDAADSLERRPGASASRPSAGGPAPATPPQRRPPAIRPLLLFALAGGCAGLATYAYHTGRVAPIALAVIIVARLGRDGWAWRRALPGLIVAALIGAITITPLALYIIGDLEGYNRRVGTVSVVDSSDLITQKPLGLLLRNAERYALMWHVRGEPNGRHHLPYVPMIDPLAGLLLALGLALSLAAIRRDRRSMALLLLWSVYFVPGVFSSDAPHAMRSLGTLAPACMLAGVGLAALLKAPHRRQAALVGLAFFASLLFNSWIYFGAMRTDPEVYGEFDLVETAVGRVVQAAAASPDPALHTLAIVTPAELAHADTVRYLAYGVGIGQLEAGLPAGGPALVLLAADAPLIQREAALAALGAGAVQLQAAITYPGSDQPILLAYGRGAEAQAALDLASP